MARDQIPSSTTQTSTLPRLTPSASGSSPNSGAFCLKFQNSTLKRVDIDVDVIVKDKYEFEISPGEQLEFIARF